VKPTPKPPLATQGSLPKPPAAAEVQAAVALIKEVFSKEYDAAKRPAERAKLAEKLLAQEAKAETVERYALLEESLRLSVEGGNVKSAFSAADRMTAVFQQPPKFHLDYLTKLVDSVGVPKDQGELSTAALRIAQFASDVEQFDDAEQLGRLALKAATKARAAAAQKSVRDFADRLKQTRDRHTAYKESAAKLEKEPTDAAANLAAGRYFCFSRGEWSIGIPHLALSSDAVLKQIAEQELKLTSESPVSAQMAIAEAWQTAAPSASAGDRPYYSASALYWFKKSLPKLSALQKLKAEQEIKKIGTLEVERK
jgi:hypothetical protein